MSPWILTADGTRLPMFLTANVKRDNADHPEVHQGLAVDAADRRAYEKELSGSASAPRSSNDGFANSPRHCDGHSFHRS